ncbi:MAG: hypothetical protein EOO39_26945 [Cytophagaceae bacterium]|nr:MAG: hypothetical protein EOO39_26945 [Cytophagaceae bacterium]
MAVAYAPDQSSESNRALQLLANIKGSMLDFFDTNEPFFISNQSMRVLILGLADRLEKAVEADKEEALFTQWNKAMPQAKRNLVTIAREFPLPLADGGKLSIMGEDKSTRLLRICPDAPEY